MNDTPEATAIVVRTGAESVLAVQKRAHLYGLLKTITDVDNEVLDLDIEEIEKVMGDSREKIDNYKFLIDRVELLAESLERKVKVFAKAAKSYRSKVAAMETRLLNAMQANGFEQLAGYDWQVQIKSSTYCDPKLAEPADHHKIHFPDFVVTSYDWDKKKLTEALKPLGDVATMEEVDRHAAAKELAEMKQRPRIVFSPYKDFV